MKNQNNRQPDRVNSAGVTMVEYALLIGLVCLGLVVFWQILLSDSQEYYDTRKNSLNYIDRKPLITPVP